MKESNLRLAVGLSVLIAHFSTILLVAVLFFAGGFLFEELTTTVAIILPLFSAYTTAFVKYVIATRIATTGAQVIVSGIFATLSIAFPLLMFLSLVIVVFLHAYGRFESFEQFKITLGLVEVVFGAYL